MTARPRVLILGGGFAGLETAFMLRQKVGDAVSIGLVSDTDRFLFKPNTIYIPFGADVESLLIPLDKPLHRRDITFHPGRVAEVDPDRKTVTLVGGEQLTFDFLVLATGAAMRPEEIPGLGDHASTIFTPAEMLKLRASLDAMERRARQGEQQEVLFVVPPNNKCSGPLYEIVFMLETWARRQKIRDALTITYSTYEASFIQAFGPRLHEVVTAEFAARGIHGVTGQVVEKVGDREVLYADGTRRVFDHLISFPPYVAALHLPGLGADDRGFVPTVFETRQVVGHPDIFAPGDGGDFPIKQAFLAFLQADATAEALRERITGRAIEHPFDPISMCVMEMFDKATFAQVPLSLTGDPARPVTVRDDASDLYKVGVSPMWRLGKKVLGIYLPMRFRAGEPFHAGAGWQMMDLGLKGMVGVLAD